MTPPLALLALAVLQQPIANADPRTPYWQQDVAYEISARLDESRGVLGGAERIRYVNRSPDTLTTFALHLHLNAFRPGSRWADADSAEGRRRFNDLADPDFAFNHVSNVRIMGLAAAPVYPFAPDSTIVRFALPRPLAPGDSMTVELDWDARPSTLPRRQGRQGRRFDFAQWYPKVVVYDRLGWQEQPLYPGGEFYGEFGSFLVALDVPADQVVGATGVPVCGDPGWEAANRQPSRPVEYQRDYYGDRTPASIALGADGSASDSGAACAVPGLPGANGAPADGRKRIVWYAENVHHFAMSLNAQYRYEGGRFRNVAVHVLYQPGDSATWGNGVAVERTEIALEWLDRLYGRFAWPQLTNVHRIEGGGTEFPMMVHNGSADQGLIVHEVGHNYTMGILANNEWREGWLDEGFTSFQTSWFWETMGRTGGYERLESQMLGLELAGMAEPTSLVSEKYRDFVTYNVMIYSRGELFFQQLRYIVGDSVMHRILRTYYDRWKLKHVDEAAFRAVAEEVSGRDLSTFFGQWLHSVERYDYSVGRLERRRLSNGRWRARVEVTRNEVGRIPVEIAVVAGGDTVLARTDGLAEREWVEVETDDEPERVVVDPRVRAHDWLMLNNRRGFGFDPGWLRYYRDRDAYLGGFFSSRVRRDRLTAGYAPVVWYNDAGGLTLGIRERANYLGRFEDNTNYLTASTGWGVDDPLEHRNLDFWLGARSPAWLRAPQLETRFDLFRTEGRAGVWAQVARTRQEHLAFGATHTEGVALGWTAVTEPDFVDPLQYDDAGTVEAQLFRGIATRSGPWSLSADLSLGGGLMYSNAGPGITTDRRYDGQPYFRGTLEAAARRSLGAGTRLSARLFAGAALGEDDVVRQRRIFLGGANPYERLRNPFIRSRGALLVRPDFNYHAPGEGNMRGYAPWVSANAAVALNLQLEQSLFSRGNGAGLFRRVWASAFGDMALADGDASLGLADPGDPTLLGDAGVGLAVEHRIGATEFVTRVDFPIYVGRAALAQDPVSGGDDRVGFRWTFSFTPAL